MAAGHHGGGLGYVLYCIACYNEAAGSFNAQHLASCATHAGCMAATEAERYLQALHLGGGAGVGGGADLLPPHGMDAAWVSEVRQQMQHN